MSNENESIVADNEEEVAETGKTGDEAAKETEVEKPKRTPEEELNYFEGRAKRLRKDLGLEEEVKPEPKKKAAQKSDGLDLGAKAFLSANGIKGSKEFDFVQSELKKFGGELDMLLENDYFKSSLEKFRALDKTAEAIPTGKRSGTGAIDSVEYWMTKPFEEVPKDMRPKVVQAKLDKEKNKGNFYNS
jgi:hypothetical protein